MSVAEQYNILKEKLLHVERFAGPAQFTKFLSIAIHDFDLKFKTTRVDSLDCNVITVSGSYDPEEDQQTFPCIDIHILYSTTQKDILTQDLNADEILLELYSTIFHEKMHQAQYRNRKFSQPKKRKWANDEQAYLGCPDEVEAYAVELAVEEYLKGVVSLHRTLYNNRTYKMYQTTFGIDHKVLHDLETYSNKYFNKLQGEGHVSH